LDQKAHLPKPDLLAIATLPFPSMEHPLVAGHVQYLQQQRQDWFRTYLLPIAAAYLQRGITPLRHRSGRSAEATPSLVAILDSRIIARSYGAQLLDPLGPIARLSRSQLFA
jgi:ATP-dependent DNA helicase DinG